jgi:hypothetical protein
LQSRWLNGATCPQVGPRHRTQGPPFREHTMLMTLAIILIVLWLLGVVSAYTRGGLVKSRPLIAQAPISWTPDPPQSRGGGDTRERESRSIVMSVAR